MKLGDVVENTLHVLPDKSDWTETFRREREGKPVMQRGKVPSPEQER